MRVQSALSPTAIKKGEKIFGCLQCLGGGAGFGIFGCLGGLKGLGWGGGTFERFGGGG